MEHPIMSSTLSSSSPPHVLVFPLPLQGHIIPMLKLAELLCVANFKVTFLNSTHNHQRLIQHTDIVAHFARYPGFRFETVPDGLPDDHPRTIGECVSELIQSMKSTAKPFLRDILLGSKSTTHTSEVTCLIMDVILGFAQDVADEIEVPVIAFRVVSACAVWAYFCIPKLIQAGEVPFKDGEMDQLVYNVPGMDGFLRRRDLPTLCRVKDISDPQLSELITATQQPTRQAQSLILNTFEDLEGPILSHLQSHYSRIYTIGPLHALLKHRQETALSNSSSSLWEVDRTCISWLDQKPDKSVIYVSLGSVALLTRDQFLEIWAGLVQSNKYFLWAVRPDLISESDSDSPTPKELLLGTKERGLMVGWVPQEEVLAHRAVGGFMSQCGWNAVLEGITAGVPMLCWPYFYEQQLNSRYVSEVWRIGLDMKDTCDRTIVEKMVIDLMDGRRDDVARSMARMSCRAKESVAEGGSSHCNLDRLIADIKVMSKKVVNLE